MSKLYQHSLGFSFERRKIHLKTLEMKLIDCNTQDIKKNH